MGIPGLRAKDLDVLCDIFRRFPNALEVRIFGSPANGTAREVSDLDLAISCPHGTSMEWSTLCDALEQAPIIFELDIVRLEQVCNERLKDRITTEGTTIYLKNGCSEHLPTGSQKQMAVLSTCRLVLKSPDCNTYPATPA